MAKRILSLVLVVAASGVAAADCGGVCPKSAVGLLSPAVFYQAAPVVAAPPVPVVEYHPVVTGYVQPLSVPVAVRPTLCQRIAARLVYRRLGQAAARADRVAYQTQWVGVPMGQVHAD